MILSLFSLAYDDVRHEMQASPAVPVIRVNGEISSTVGINLRTLEETLDQAFKVRRAVAVAIVINSPGGSPAQANLIGQRLRLLSKERNLPVLAFVEDMAASGGYMIAVAADEIYCDEYSLVGSIGVISAGFGFDRLIEKYGVERRVHTAGTHKSKLDPFKPESASDIEFIRGLLNETHENFIKLVQTRRGDKLVQDGKVDLFNGDVWTAKRAQELGLVDGIGEMRETLKSKFGDKVRIIPIRVGPWFLQSMMSSAERLALAFGVRAPWSFGAENPISAAGWKQQLSGGAGEGVGIRAE